MLRGIFATSCSSLVPFNTLGQAGGRLQLTLPPLAAVALAPGPVRLDWDHLNTSPVPTLNNTNILQLASRPPKAIHAGKVLRG